MGGLSWDGANCVTGMDVVGLVGTGVGAAEDGMGGVDSDIVEFGGSKHVREAGVVEK